jgi:hypothetical protein
MIHTSLAAYHAMNLPLSEMVAGRIGFIHDAFMPFDYQVVTELPHDPGDLVVLIDKTGRGTKLQQLARHDGRIVLVAAPGDASFRRAYLPGGNATLPPNFVAAFVTNNEICDGRVTNVPLGVRSNRTRHLKFVAQNGSSTRDHLLYGNFTVNEDHYLPTKSGLPHIRRQLVTRLADEPWATMDVANTQRTSDKDLVDYYARMRRHRFVLSPEGSGIDCYRHWESLYLGAVPIVRTSPTMTTFADLPILFTDDYSELSETYLKEQWHRLSQRSFDIRGLLKSFYLARFLDSVSKLSNPRFLCWGFRGTREEKFLRLLEHPQQSPFPTEPHVPIAPFIAPTSVADHTAWRVADGIELEPSDRGLRVKAISRSGGAAFQAFRTLSGTRLRVSGIVELPDSLHNAAVLVTTKSKSETLGRATIIGRGQQSFCFDVTMIGEHALLMLELPQGKSGASVLIRELSIAAQL